MEMDERRKPVLKEAPADPGQRQELEGDRREGE
jgi:hypothetical protein